MLYQHIYLNIIQYIFVENALFPFLQEWGSVLYKRTCYEYWAAINLFQENTENTFNKSTKMLRWACRKYTTKDGSYELFPKLFFWNLHCVLPSFVILVPTYRPKFICPGGGNVVLKSRDWTVFASGSRSPPFSTPSPSLSAIKTVYPTEQNIVFITSWKHCF